MINFGTVFPLCYTCYLEIVLEISLFLRNTKEYNDLSYNSFKILPLCKLWASVYGSKHVEKTFLEAILWKPFQLCRRIFHQHKSAVPLMLISVEGTGKKNRLESGLKSMGDAPVLSHCSLLRNPWQNWSVCWSIVVKEKPAVGSSFFGAFATDRILKVTKKVSVHLRHYSIIPNWCTQL